MRDGFYVTFDRCEMILHVSISESLSSIWHVKNSRVKWNISSCWKLKLRTGLSDRERLLLCNINNSCYRESFSRFLFHLILVRRRMCARRQASRRWLIFDVWCVRRWRVEIFKPFHTDQSYEYNTFETSDRQMRFRTRSTDCEAQREAKYE